MSVRRHAVIRGIWRTLAQGGYTVNVQRPIANHRFPEWKPFLDAVQQRVWDFLAGTARTVDEMAQ